jgi:Putative polyhydroxyalkanoic acid system protein (PHA_gran_rgn)
MFLKEKWTVSNFTMSIPHNLSRAEAKLRLQDGIARARQQHGAILNGLSDRWDGDTLSFVLSAAGQSVSGQMFVEDHAVRLEATLPWMLAMLAGSLKGRIEQQGRAALENKPLTASQAWPIRR